MNKDLNGRGLGEGQVGILKRQLDVHVWAWVVWGGGEVIDH